jgi:hypothetical protein
MPVYLKENCRHKSHLAISPGRNSLPLSQKHDILAFQSPSKLKIALFESSPNSPILQNPKTGFILRKQVISSRKRLNSTKKPRKKREAEKSSREKRR